MNLTKTLIAIALAATTLMSGCATTPESMIYRGHDEVKANPDAVTVVLIRKMMFKSAAGKWSVAVDGRQASMLAVGTYCVVTLEAGKHSLSDPYTASDFVGEKGKVYFFSFDQTLWPVYGVESSDFDPLSQEEGSTLINKYVRVKTL